MQRYFLHKKETDGTVIFSENDSYHIQTVMRMNINDSVEVVIDSKVYHCVIISMEKVVIGKIVAETVEDHEMQNSVVLVQSLVKEQKMDWILQKSTELGVVGIYPYQAERSIVKVSASLKEEKKITRWKSIVKEASEQSKRNRIPFVGEVLSLKDLASLQGFDYKFLCTVRESEKSIKKVLSNLEKGVTMIIVVGPEGGFTTFEEETLESAGFVPISLGKTVLRTETAGMFFLSAVRYIEME